MKENFTSKGKAKSFLGERGKARIQATRLGFPLVTMGMMGKNCSKAIIVENEKPERHNMLKMMNLIKFLSN